MKESVHKPSIKNDNKYSVREQYKSPVPYLKQSLTSKVHAHALIMLPGKRSNYIIFGT